MSVIWVGVYTQAEQASLDRMAAQYEKNPTAYARKYSMVGDTRMTYRQAYQTKRFQDNKQYSSYKTKYYKEYDKKTGELTKRSVRVEGGKMAAIPSTRTSTNSSSNPNIGRRANVKNPKRNISNENAGIVTRNQQTIKQYVNQGELGKARRAVKEAKLDNRRIMKNPMGDATLRRKQTNNTGKSKRKSGRGGGVFVGKSKKGKK